MLDLLGTTYDEFETMFVEAGWCLDDIEAMWLKHLFEDEEV